MVESNLSTLSGDTLRIHSIESFGTHDGPGIRMVVFVQGCKFKCLYCANPDTIDIKGGEDIPIEEIIRRAKNMKPYFGSKGGVTISGGEPLIQSQRLIPLFKRLKEEGIHTNIDTNGRTLNKYTKELLDNYTDLVMLDVKHFDPQTHRHITGGQDVSNTLRFAQYREESAKPMWLRYVLVPGLSDQKEHLHALGNYFKDFKTIEKIEIQPYHKLGVHKWKYLGWEYQLEDVPENTPKQLNEAKNIFEQYFKEVKVN